MFNIQKGQAVQSLENQGYTSVEIQRPVWVHSIDFCGESMRFQFKAIKDGQLKTGYVCPFNVISKNVYED